MKLIRFNEGNSNSLKLHAALLDTCFDRYHEKIQSRTLLIKTTFRFNILSDFESGGIRFNE